MMLIYLFIDFLLCLVLGKMSKTTKWKPEKTKVKVVFRLQFHATHVSSTYGSYCTENAGLSDIMKLLY